MSENVIWRDGGQMHIFHDKKDISDEWIVEIVKRRFESSKNYGKKPMNLYVYL